MQPSPLVQPSLPRPLSSLTRLVLGGDGYDSFDHVASTFDAYAELGGNVFDTAHSYGRGKMETWIGEWLASRGIRESMNVVTKGGLTPTCTPDQLQEQLQTSLERLKLERIDLYFMHRDNPQVPAGEFVDVLNQALQSGKIAAFGGSNWTVARIEDANEYASSRGLVPLSALSNQCSLAKMLAPPWPGCLACSEPEFQEWLTRTQLPNFAWSCLGRGFFADRELPSQQMDPQLWATYGSRENLERRRRALWLAQQKGAELTQIALAFVLHQPYPSFALSGPKTRAELVSAFGALSILLSPLELAFLDLSVDWDSSDVLAGNPD